MFNFIKQTITHPLKTGAFAPSGEELTELITTSADLQSAKVVVELGCGNGVFTEQIVKKIGPNTFFFVIEINEDFIEATQKRCPNVMIYSDNAVNISKYLKQNGFDHCDVIISGLPFAFFNTKTQRELMDAISTSLKPQGKFLTFSYVHGLYFPSGKHFKDLLTKYFTSVAKSEVVLKNIPPAFVYVCIK